MALRFGDVVVMSIGILVAQALQARAKPRETPGAPDIEFKVPSNNSQDYFQPESDQSKSIIVPGPCAWASTPELAVGSIGGSGIGFALCGHSGRPIAAIRGGCGSLIPCSASQGLELSSRTLTRNDLAQAVFEMAETHRKANDWEEARHWYAGVIKFWPNSQYAKFAAVRLDRLATFRIAAEAAEEQSEEPPFAERSERLNVMPRELKR
jgi:hypothetical protein